MSNNRFTIFPTVGMPRSNFDLSHTYKTTFDAGKLIPIYCEEVLPGDSFNVDANFFVRLTSPLQVPVMDNIFFDVQFFFCPTRLVWDHWEAFNGEQKHPGDTTDYLVPQLKSDSTSNQPQKLPDYFGIPTNVVNLGYNPLPLRAYWLIWNEWFRDQNLQNSASVYFGDEGKVWDESEVNPIGLNWYDLAPRGKRHDFFTSAFTMPQFGVGVSLPLGTTAPVVGNGMTLGLMGTNTSGELDYTGLTRDAGGYGLGALNSLYGQTLPNLTVGSGNPNLGAGTGLGVTDDPEKSGLVADLSSATAATINSLRMAFQMQAFLERQLLGGHRYIEQIYSMFGVSSPDQRLQRPEFLGSINGLPLNINTVAQTSSTDGTTPQANLSAYGLTASSGNDVVNKSFVEHGFIIGLASVRADLSYQQGLSKMWSRRTLVDYYFPPFANLGMDTILNKEIYAQGSDVLDENGEPVDEGVFGYQERWSEYRYHPNMITGKFRSSDPQSLDIWHLAQDFESLPVLNHEFIEEKPPIDRVIAVQDEPQFLMDAYFKVKAARVMPVYSIPANLSRF